MPVDLDLLGLRLEEGSRHRIEKVVDIQQRRHAKHDQHHHHASVGSPDHQHEFRPASTCRRNADDRHRTDEERGENQLHLGTLPVKLRDLGDVGLHIDGTGDKEQGDLADGMHDDMKRRALGRHLRRDRRAENDVGQLADRRIGKPRFQVILGDGHAARGENGEAGRPDKPGRGAGVGKIIDAEDIDRDRQQREHTRLDHGHRMQQRRDGRRCHHRGGKPAVQRHDRRLADTKGERRKKPRRDRGRHRSGQNAARHEIKPAGHHPDIDHRRQQQNHRTADKNAHIETAGVPRRLAVLVGDKRECRECQDFVEDEQHQQIAGPGNAKRGMDGDGIESGKACLVLFMVAAHIAGGIDRRQDPQARSDKSEDRAERRHPKAEFDPRGQLGQHP